MSDKTYVYLTKIQMLPVTISWIIQNQPDA